MISKIDEALIEIEGKIEWQRWIDQNETPSERVRYMKVTDVLYDELEGIVEALNFRAETSRLSKEEEKTENIQFLGTIRSVQTLLDAVESPNN